MRKQRSDSTPGPKPKRRAEAQTGTVRQPKLSPAARRVWRQLAPLLDEAQLIDGRDALTLAIACETAAFVQQAAAQLHRDGLTSQDAAHKDTERRSPTWVVFQQAAQTWLAYAGHLGLSPKARAALRADTYSPASEFEQYLMRRPQLKPVEAKEW